VLAAVVSLLERTFIRVGNEEYARVNRSFGLTTLRDRHAEINGSTVHFRFRGKSGVRQVVAVSDHRLARIVRCCQELPGQELFQYRAGAGRYRAVTSADVNAYLREAGGGDFTAKTFRTWAGTVLAAQELANRPAPASEAEARRELAAAVELVAARLGNTRAVCRCCYVHPAVPDAYRAGTLAAELKVPEQAHEGLEPFEAAVQHFLSRRSAAGGLREEPRQAG
jgi:DNA topoisomerase-1